MLLYIKNLPPDATKNHIRALFAGLGVADYEVRMTDSNSAFTTFKDNGDLLKAYRLKDTHLRGHRLTLLLVSEEEMDIELTQINRDHTQDRESYQKDSRALHPKSTLYEDIERHGATRYQSNNAKCKEKLHDEITIDHRPRYETPAPESKIDSNRYEKDPNILDTFSYQLLERHEWTRSHSGEHPKSQEPSSLTKAQEIYNYTNYDSEKDWGRDSGKLLPEPRKLYNTDLYYKSSVSRLSRNQVFDPISGGSNAGSVQDYNTSLDYSSRFKGRETNFYNRPSPASESQEFDPISSQLTSATFKDYDTSLSSGNRSQGLDLVSVGSNAGIVREQYPSRSAAAPDSLPMRLELEGSPSSSSALNLLPEKKSHHYLVLKGLASDTSISGIHKLFDRCNIITGSSKMICSNGEAQYAYMEVESSQDVVTACEMDADVLNVDGYTLSVKPILQEVLEHNLETIALLQNSKNSALEIVTEQSECSHLRTGPQFDPKLLDERRADTRDRSHSPSYMADSHKSDRDTDLKRRALAPMSIHEMKKPMLRGDSASVKFKLMPFPGDEDQIIPNVLSWIQKKMEHVEVLDQPEMNKEDTPHGVVVTVTLSVRTPVRPIFPRFVIINKLAVVITGPEEKRTCPACRSMHNHRYPKQSCIALRSEDSEGDKTIFLSNSLMVFHPSAEFPCSYSGVNFISIQDAMDHQLRLELGAGPENIHQLKLRAWEAKSFDLIKSLYKSQIEENEDVALALKASAQKNIIFICEDRVLGSGLFDHVKIENIQISYLPGENYIGTILEELREELTLAEQGRRTIFNVSRLPFRAPAKPALLPTPSRPIQPQYANPHPGPPLVPPHPGPGFYKAPSRPAIEHHTPLYPPVVDAPSKLMDTDKEVTVNKVTVTFDCILPEENVDWIQRRVTSWVTKYMPHVIVRDGPMSQRMVEHDGTIHYLVRFTALKPLAPAFPKFAIVHAIACMISHTGQELVCSLCRDVHIGYTRNPCKALLDVHMNPDRVFYIPSSPLHILSPLYTHSCVYLGKVYDSVATALVSIMEVEFGCPPSDISEHKLFDWQTRAYSIIKVLIKSQFNTSSKMRDMLLATASKRIIFMNGDLVLGSGDATISIDKIHPYYIPGANYVGIIMEELRAEFRHKCGR